MPDDPKPMTLEEFLDVERTRISDQRALFRQGLGPNERWRRRDKMERMLREILHREQDAYISPNELMAEFERILIGLDHDTVRLMTLEDAFGLRTEIRFTEVLRNPKASPERFVFVPPEGVDVVGLELPESTSTGEESVVQ